MTGTNVTGASAPDSAPDQIIAALTQNWWAIAMRGVVGILFGLAIVFFPGTTMATLVLAFAAYAFADGIFAIASAVRAAAHYNRWSLLLLEGIINISVAGFVVLWPTITVAAFVWLVAAWAIVTGGIMLQTAFRFNTHHGLWWLAFCGVISLIYGLLLIPASVFGILVLAWWLGVYGLISGAVLLILAFSLRARRRHSATSHMAS